MGAMVEKRIAPCPVCGRKPYAEGFCYSHFQAWRTYLGAYLKRHRIAPCPGSRKVWGGGATVHDGCCKYPEPWAEGVRPKGFYQTLRAEWSAEQKG